MNIIKQIKKDVAEITNSFLCEPVKKSYSRFLLLSLYLVIFYLLTSMFIIGRMLVEKVLILNPLNIELSLESLIVIQKFSTITETIAVLASLSAAFLIYKEYREFCFRRIIKENRLDVIK